MTEPEPVYVPVTNANYLPEGIVQLEGWVPPDSGGIPEDKSIQQQKTALEDDPVNALASGPHEDNAWVDPTPPLDEGTIDPPPDPPAEEPATFTTSSSGL